VASSDAAGTSSLVNHAVRRAPASRGDVAGLPSASFRGAAGAGVSTTVVPSTNDIMQEMG